MADSRLRLMRLLVIDSSSDTGDQRSPGILPPDALQPFRRRCRLLGQFGDVANRILIDIGIDRLHWLAIATIENRLERLSSLPGSHLAGGTGSRPREPQAPWSGTSPAFSAGSLGRPPGLPLTPFWKLFLPLYIFLFFRPCSETLLYWSNITSRHLKKKKKKKKKSKKAILRFPRPPPPLSEGSGMEGALCSTV